MALEDVFGTSFQTRTDPDPHDTPVTPLDPEGVDMDDATPLSFEGFVNNQPLLVERPTRFLARVKGAVESLIRVPDDDQDGGMGSRIHISPIMPIPTPTLYGNELFPNTDAVAYPMIHWPANHPWDPDGDQPYDEYLLGLYAFHTLGGMVHCEDGNLYSYPVKDPWEVDDEPWATAMEWAGDAGPLLARLNLARLTGFALSDWEREREPLARMYALWHVTDSPSKVADLEDDAVMALDPLLKVLSDLPYRPYEED